MLNFVKIFVLLLFPNIAGITQQAAKSSGKRNAQNIASLSSAASAAGYTNVAADMGAAIAASPTALA